MLVLPGAFRWYSVLLSGADDVPKFGHSDRRHGTRAAGRTGSELVLQFQ